MDQPLSPLQSTFAQFLAEEENIGKMDQPLSLLPSTFTQSLEEEVNTSQPVSLLQRTFTQSLEEEFNISQMDQPLSLLQSTFPSSQPLAEEVKTSKKTKHSSRLQRTQTLEEFDSDKVSELSSIVYLSDKDFDFEFEEEDEPPKPLPSKTPASILPWKQAFKFKQNWLGETDPAKIGPANCNLTTDSTPVEFFSLIFDDDMFGDVMNWTNKRAAETIDNSKRRRTKNLTWKNLTLSEMKSFFAALYLMGINRMPSYKMYWSCNTTLFSAEGVRSLFSRQRFHDIYNCVCLRDPSHVEPDKENKFYKIEPFALSLLTNSQFYYRPHQDLSIDESMIRFRGRAGFKVYEPRKPIKHGLKAYVLCDAHTGYVLNWKLYTGKSNETVDDIVMKLIKGLGGDGYRIFMDSYYTSVKLFQNLKELNLGACGTTVGDRLHMTKEIANDVKGVGDHQIQYYTLESDPSILLSCWKDHKLVHVLSNYHSINQVDVERRLRRKDRTELTKIENLNCKETLSIPESIADYNAHMGGVDRFDQYASYYIATLGTSRWYVKVMFHLCEMAMINSYIIYKSTFLAAGLKPLAHLDYRKEVIRGLSRELRQSKFLLTSPEKKRKCEPKFRHSDSLLTSSSQDRETETSLQFLSSLLAESTQATTQSTIQTFQSFESSITNNQNDFLSISQAINNRTVHRYYTRSQPWPKNLKTRNKKRTISQLENHPCRLQHIATSELSEGKIRKSCMICKWRMEKQQEMDDIARLKGLIKDDNREPLKKKRVHQTSFWCETCEVPVCLLPCYDEHIELRRLKKLKSNDNNY